MPLDEGGGGARAAEPPAVPSKVSSPPVCTVLFAYSVSVAVPTAPTVPMPWMSSVWVLPVDPAPTVMEFADSAPLSVTV